MRGALAVLLLVLAACGGGLTPVESSTSPSASASSPSLTAIGALAHACKTYDDFVAYAQHDISKGTEFQIADRLTKYEDALKEDGQTLRNAGADQFEPILQMASAIQDLKGLTVALGKHDPKTTRVLRIVLKAGQSLMFFCPG